MPLPRVRCFICLDTLDMLRRLIADWEPTAGKTVRVDVPCPKCGRLWGAVAFEVPARPAPGEHDAAFSLVTGTITTD